MNLDIIAYCRSPFKQKFGIPRQARLVPVIGRIEPVSPWNDPACFDGLTEFSHIWLQFIFHQVDHWQCKVRPPRLGGQIKKGVFATRAPVRPNRIGLSAVRLLKIEINPLQLWVEGIDILDGTPIIDIRPYIPYADAIPNARSGFSAVDFFSLKVEWSEQAENDLNALNLQPQKQILQQLIELNPRPAYQKSKKQYGLYFDQYNLVWQMIDAQTARIDHISKITDR